MCTPEDLIGEPSTKFIHLDDQSGAVSTWMQMVSAPGIPKQWHGRYQTADGGWQRVPTVNVTDEPGSC